MPVPAILVTIGSIIGGALARIFMEYLRGVIEPAIRGGGTATRTEAWIRSGWCAKITSEIFDACTSERPHHSAGMHTEGILRCFEEFIRAVAQASIVLTEEIAEELYTELLQEGLSQAIQTSLGGAVSSILNYWRGGQPLYPDDIEDVGESVEDLDTMAITLLTGMAGANIPTTHFRLKRGFDRLVEGKLVQLRNQLRYAVERVNDTVLWMHERSYYRALREWDEVLSSIEACYWKGVNLYDHVCERALSRLQEIKSEVETLKKWWEYTQEHPETPLVDEMTADITLQEDEMEADAVYETATTILSWIDNSLNQISPDLTDVVDGIDTIMYRVADVYNRLIQASRMTFADELQKIDDAMYKIAAIRNKVDSQTTPDMPFEAVTPVTNASGLDPTDPTWYPDIGYTDVWEFDRAEDLDSFANYDRKSAFVEAGMLRFAPGTGDEGYAWRLYTDRFLKVYVVCLRVSIQSVTEKQAITYIVSRNGTNSYDVALQVVDTQTLELLDVISGSSVQFTNPMDWFVVKIDVVNGIARVYNRDKEVIAELGLTPESTNEGRSEIYVCEPNNYPPTSPATFDVDVDWIAVHELEYVSEQSVSEDLQDNLSESVGFGTTEKVSEDLQDNLGESVGFGTTAKVSEDLQQNLSESVTITNE